MIHRYGAAANRWAAQRLKLTKTARKTQRRPKTRSRGANLRAWPPATLDAQNTTVNLDRVSFRPDGRTARPVDLQPRPDGEALSGCAPLGPDSGPV